MCNQYIHFSKFCRSHVGEAVGPEVSKQSVTLMILAPFVGFRSNESYFAGRICGLTLTTLIVLRCLPKYRQLRNDAHAFLTDSSRSVSNVYRILINEPPIRVIHGH